MNELRSEKSQPTQKTKQKSQRIMDYVCTFPNTHIPYYSSNMVLHVDSDAAYLVVSKSRSRVAGYYYLSDDPNVTKLPKINGAILEFKILWCMVVSAAETVGIFHNAQVSIPI